MQFIEVHLDMSEFEFEHVKRFNHSELWKSGDGGREGINEI